MDHELHIDCRINDSAQNLRTHVEHAIGLDLPDFTDAKVHTGRVSICAFAPSLKHELDVVRRNKERGDLLICVNAAHDYLIRHGIQPDVCVLLDSWERMAQVITPHPGVKYWIASQCHPDVFERLRSSDVTLWHAWISEASLGASLEKLLGPKGWIVYTGGTAALGSAYLAWVKGYRRFSFFGIDSSFETDFHAETVVVYGDQAVPSDDLYVTYHGKDFHTVTSLALQAQQFEQMFLKFNTSKILVHGVGLIPWICERLNVLKYGQPLTDV